MSPPMNPKNWGHEGETDGILYRNERSCDKKRVLLQRIIEDVKGCDEKLAIPRAQTILR